MLEPKRQLQERILAMGPFGSGKSYAWLSIARTAQKTGSNAKFYVIDTDLAIDYMLAEQFEELNNVVVRPVHEWPEYEKAADDFLKTAGPNDWIVIDMIDTAWEAVQSYYTQEVWGKDIGDYFLEVRKNMKGNRINALDGWKDWSVINKIYFQWQNKLIYQVKSHVFAASKVEAVNLDQDDKETQRVFGPYGLKPKGQKALGHQFHTILLFSCVKPGDWRITTIRERGKRKPFEDQPLKDFVIQYLVGRAGWKL